MTEFRLVMLDPGGAGKHEVRSDFGSGCRALGSRCRKSPGAAALAASTAASPAPDCVERDGSAPKADERKSDGAKSQRKFVATGAQQAVLPVNPADGNGQVDENRKRRATREQPQQQ